MSQFIEQTLNAPTGWASLVACMLCGSLIGIERQTRGKPVGGIRTSILIISGTYFFLTMAISLSPNTTRSSSCAWPDHYGCWIPLVQGGHDDIGWKNSLSVHLSSHYLGVGCVGDDDCVGTPFAVGHYHANGSSDSAWGRQSREQLPKLRRERYQKWMNKGRMKK